MLADAIEAKDPFVRAASDEVSACLEAVARRLELEPEASERLVFAGLLRDVGKLGISDRVLLKPGPLNTDERRTVELHPLIGARIVERVPGLAGLAPAIRHHHERWDGAGYPSGLSGEEIPIEARVLAVADVYSALTSTRPYRQPVSTELACEEIVRSSGSQFDPQVAKLFVEEIRRREPDEADRGTLAESVDVPAVQARREPGEPLLGHGLVGSTDHVTLLFSHRFLQEAADSEAKRAQRRRSPFAVLMVELTGALADQPPGGLRRGGPRAPRRGRSLWTRPSTASAPPPGASVDDAWPWCCRTPDTARPAGLAADVAGSLDGSRTGRSDRRRRVAAGRSRRGRPGPRSAGARNRRLGRG